MIDLIAQDPRFPACMAEKLFTYGMGRGPTDFDAPHLETITQAFAAAGHRFRSLVKLIVGSEPFRTRSSDAGGTP